MPEDGADGAKTKPDKAVAAMAARVEAAKARVEKTEKAIDAQRETIEAARMAMEDRPRHRELTERRAMGRLDRMIHREGAAGRERLFDGSTPTSRGFELWIKVCIFNWFCVNVRV